MAMKTYLANSVYCSDPQMLDAIDAQRDLVQITVFGTARTKKQFVELAGKHGLTAPARDVQVNDVFTPWRELIELGLVDPSAEALYASPLHSGGYVARIVPGAAPQRIAEWVRGETTCRFHWAAIK